MDKIMGGKINPLNKYLVIMIDTGETILKAANFLKKEGAKNIYVAATHGIFSGDCIDRLEMSPIKEIVITDTIPSKSTSILVKRISIANYLAKKLTT